MNEDFDDAKRRHREETDSYNLAMYLLACEYHDDGTSDKQTVPFIATVILTVTILLIVYLIFCKLIDNF